MPGNIAAEFRFNIHPARDLQMKLTAITVPLRPAIHHQTSSAQSVQHHQGWPGLSSQTKANL